jgi:hypothetical protein
MAFDIADFKANFTNGGARPNLFEVRVSSPVGDIASDIAFSFTCKAAQIPASTIAQIDVPYFGRQIRFAGNRTFEPWTVTILNDEGFTVRRSLENWMEAINGNASNVQSVNQTQYKDTDAQVVHYGKDGSIIAEYNFVGMFPTEIAAIDLDWETNDQLEEFQVTFGYDYWERNLPV